MGEQGRRRVLEEFTWERVARIIESRMGELKVKRKRDVRCRIYDNRRQRIKEKG